VVCRYLPEDVTGMESLHILHLQDNCLTTLPSGRYLDCLLALDLSNNSFTSIPAALQDAPGLQRYVPNLLLLQARSR